MNRYEEGMKLIEESCGNRKDNTIALSTIATGSGLMDFLALQRFHLDWRVPSFLEPSRDIRKRNGFKNKGNSVP